MEGKRNSWDFMIHHEDKKIKTIQSTQSFSNGEFSHIPDEIITEILARLPVKSLLRFRCVCKSWISLISNPQFIKSHLEISRKDASFASQRIMLTILHPQFNLKHCSLRSVMYEQSTDAFTLDYPKKHPYRAVWVLGSVNGLVCIAIDEKDILLWNPSTKKSNLLPPMSVKVQPAYFNVYGFGYNERRDDYNVVSIFCKFDNGGVRELLVNMYSLRTDSWKSIGDFNRGIPLDDSGLFAAGKIHFMTTPEYGPNFSWGIVSFDLESEAYGMVEQPSYGEGVSDCSLGTMGGCLCIMCDYCETRADVWVMKEYGIKESWARVVTIPYFSNPGKHMYSKPLCVLPSGEILLVFESHFVIYDPKDNCLRRPATGNLGEFLEADAYFESLVSPIANGR